MDHQSRSALLIAAFGLLSSASPASAQAIHGVVVEDLSGAFVPGAFVALLDTAGTVANTVRSDSTGRFLVIAPAPGRYDLRVFRLGYTPAMSPDHDVTAGRALEVEIRLAASPISLDSIVVTTDRRRLRLERVGFYERRARGGFGYFFTREEIAEKRPSRFSDLLLGVPSVAMRPTVPGKSDITFRQGCRPQLLINGFPAGLGPDFTLDEMLNPFEIEAMEVYVGPSGAPIQLGARNRCGAILVWLK